MRGVEVVTAAVDFEGEHGGCGRGGVRVVEGDAEVVGFCGGFGGGDVGGELVVGVLPLFGLEVRFARLGVKILGFGFCG